MGCFSGKTKKPLEITKPLERHTSNIITHSLDVPQKVIERSSVKHTAPVSDQRLTKDVSYAESHNGVLQSSKKTSKQYEEISAALSSHFLFNSISQESLSAIIEEIQLYSFNPRETVFSQNSPARNFYIVAAGRVEVIVNGKVKKVISKGEQFGELALLHDSLRTATVTTVDRSLLWVLSREAFRAAVQSISSKKYEENKQFIESIPIFQNFTGNQKEILLSMIVSHEFTDGQKIVVEGDPGNMLYIIKSGSVSCSKAGQEIRKLGPGDFFGEQALLYNTQRTATVSALGKITLLSLGREDLVTALGSHLQQIIYRNSQRIAIEKSKALKALTKSQIEAAINQMKIQTYQAGQVVIGRGSRKGRSIFIVLKGAIKSGNKFLGIYSCIGDEEVFSKSRSTWEENWEADIESDIAVLIREDLEIALGNPLGMISTQNEVLIVLQRVQLLRALPMHKLEALITALKIYEFHDGDAIFSEGDEGNAFYIVKEGQVEIIKGGASIRFITKHDFFGERSIILNENRTATVIARGNVLCWYLSKADFLSMIDEGIRKQLTKRMELQNDKIELIDLNIVKLLGKGMFGNVFLTFCPSAKVCYALKTVQRSKISAYDIYDNIILERKILLQIDHPLIIKLVKTFKDDTRLYFLMEYVQGMDLFDALRELNLLNNDNSRFYIACLLLMFEHLHERSIIYRDLKPENVMIDLEGYPKLIDFGTAKMLQQRTYSIVGTPHYMAPEVIKGTGYGLSADIWSIGIILYEFVCGSVPFGEEEDDPFKVYNKVLEHVLKYPSYISSNKAKAVIEKMLDTNPAMRGSVKTLKEHVWFVGLNWDSVLGKQLKPPFIPKAENLSTSLQKNRNIESLQEIIAGTEDKNIEQSSKRKLTPVNWDEEF